MTIRERLDALHERGLLSDDDIALLAAGDHTLRIQTADKMIENVVGVLGLPLGLAPNF
jgi:hydroxymethylglutaryl-CoA reductase